MGLRKLFTEHPDSVGETYFQHLGAASWFGIRMLGGAFACFMHALLPFTFRRTGSECISALYERMVLNRNAAQAHAPRANQAHAPRANAVR